MTSRFNADSFVSQTIPKYKRVGSNLSIFLDLEALIGKTKTCGLYIIYALLKSKLYLSQYSSKDKELRSYDGSSHSISVQSLVFSNSSLLSHSINSSYLMPLHRKHIPFCTCKYSLRNPFPSHLLQGVYSILFFKELSVYTGTLSSACKS